MKEKRDETIILRLSKTEKNRIYEKMLSMGIRSLSAYIRKMALDGYCLHLDLKELQRMAYVYTSALLATTMRPAEVVVKLFIRIANRVALLYNWFNKHTHKIGEAVRLKILKMRYCRPLGGIA